jgi:hypothetical protein
MDLAKIEGDEIVIRISLDTLPIAAEAVWSDDGYEISDIYTFAKELVWILNREEENGDTIVTDMLDKGINEALEQGVLGISGGDFD